MKLQSFGQKMMRTSCHVFLSFAIMVSSTATFAISPSPQSSMTDKQFFTLVLENLRSRDQLIKVMEASDVSVEAMKIIEPDLRQRLPDSKPFPKLKIKNDQIFANGKYVGVRITDYENMKLLIHGKAWKLNPEKPSDEIYQDLIRLLSPTPVAQHHWMNWLLPQAEAQLPAGLLRGAIGGIFGVIAGVVGAKLTGNKDKTGGFAAVLGLLGVTIGVITKPGNRPATPASTPAEGAQ